MKVGELEIPDSAVEAVLKAAGKRVVDEADYLKKAEAANDLQKFRQVTGEGRSVDEIGAALKAYEEYQHKSKTQTELLMAEVKRQQEIIAAREAEVKKAQKEIKNRDVKQYFDEAMVANKMKIIDPILAPFREQIANLDETSLTPEALKAQVNDALKKADELQRGELLRLGINGITQEQPSSGFGAGYSEPPTFNAPVRGSEFSNPADLHDIMRMTSATPMGVPLGNPAKK